MNSTDSVDQNLNGYVVIWDDNICISVLMSWDDDCEGALCCGSGPIAIFPTRKEARKAINISTLYAKLCRAQGKPANDDFLSGHIFLRIVPTKPATK